MAKEQGRVIMRIELSPDAAKSYNTSAEERGMTHIATTSRIVEWFIAQDEEVQAAILGNHPTRPSRDELTQLILEYIKTANRS
jgi:hypothetical protein